MASMALHTDTQMVRAPKRAARGGSFFGAIASFMASFGAAQRISAALEDGEPVDRADLAILGIQGEKFGAVR